MRNLKNLKYLVLGAEMQEAEHQLSFHFTMQSGLVKNHRFSYMDCEILNAVFNEESCSYIKVRPKVGVICNSIYAVALLLPCCYAKILSQLFEHFHRSPEVLAIASPEAFGVRSFRSQVFNTVAEQLKYLSTGLNLNPQDFDVYDYQGRQDKVEMIFCMREVAAFVGFSEAIEVADVDFFFSTGGRAVKYHSKQDYIKSTLVLATIEHAQSAEVQQAPLVPAPHREATAAARERGGQGRCYDHTNTEGIEEQKEDSIVGVGKQDVEHDDALEIGEELNERYDPDQLLGITTGSKSSTHDEHEPAEPTWVVDTASNMSSEEFHAPKISTKSRKVMHARKRLLEASSSSDEDFMAIDRT
jgi:hypothetical protein